MTEPKADSTQLLGRNEQPFRAFNLDLSDPRDRLFADYELLERIGGGGMGVVYRARQLSLDREVALKIFAYDPFAVDDMLARFHSEARHAGRLQHPNIVPVFDIGKHENLHFFSMGLVRGPTLDRWLRSEARSHRQLAQMMRTCRSS
jgi:serine/threonine-protein kinase